MADQVHQVARILPVMDRERRIEPDVAGVEAKEPRPDRMKGAGPGDWSERRQVRGPERRGHDPLDPAGHLGRGSA